MLRRILNRVVRGVSAPATALGTPQSLAVPREAADGVLAPEALRERWERELARDPLYAPAHVALAELDRHAGRYEAAIAHYLTAIARFPDEPKLLHNLGTLYIETGELDEAIARLERSLALAPDFAQARDNLARALMHARRFAEAEIHERALLANEPESIGLRFRLGHTLLMQGKLDDGWAEYEWRLRRRENFNWGLGNLPEWDGADPAGKHIRVIAEQGLGDAMLFARFVPLLAARGAEVQFVVRPPLERLFQASFAADSVEITTERHENLAGIDARVHLLSLPYRLGLGRDALRRVGAYLRAPGEARALWQSRMEATSRPRIGIVWAGNPERRGDENRSIPPQRLAPLVAAAPGATWVSLQAGIASDAPRPFAIDVDCMQEVTDFADTVAIIERLDAVVSVDTSVAHAAAAAGKPVVVLAPHNVCWRWKMEGLESPWYTGVEVIRAARPGAWAPVVERASAALTALVSRSS
jgi:tetratricopeptide (TPR) repeat protein